MSSLGTVIRDFATGVVLPVAIVAPMPQSGHTDAAKAKEQIRQTWLRRGQALRARSQRNLRDASLYECLRTTLYTLRDITSSLYGTRVDGTTVPEVDIKVYLSDVVDATTMGVFTTDGLDAVPKIKATETRTRNVMAHAVKDALTLLDKMGADAASNAGFVLFMANDRHVYRSRGQSRSVYGEGRARRGAGMVVSARGAFALVATLDIAIEGVNLAVVR